VSAQRVALAAVADLGPSVVPIAGARRPETVRACTAAVHLDEEDRALLKTRFGWRDILAPPDDSGVSGLTADGEVSGLTADPPEVVLVMGIQGAGKTTLVADWVDRGYERLNRDERSGTMDDLHRILDQRLAAGARRVVADNTYTTRAGRQVAIAVARRHRGRVVGVWLDAPLAEAQTNVILRMLDVHGRLLEPEQMVRARDPSSLGPGAVFRMSRALEPPALDEGFSSLTVIPFARRPRAGHHRAAEFLALEAAERGVRPSSELALIFGWRPGTSESEVARLQDAFGASVRCCSHPGGPPRCWCRPPLPGLLVEFALRHEVDPGRSVVVGTKPVHAAMARILGAAYRAA
jgi:predicted kinase